MCRKKVPVKEWWECVIERDRERDRERERERESGNAREKKVIRACKRTGMRACE